MEGTLYICRSATCKDMEREVYEDVVNNQKVMKCVVCHRVLKPMDMLSSELRARGLYYSETRPQRKKDIIPSHKV